MRRLAVYGIRIVAAILAFAAVLYVSHGPSGEYEASFGSSYASACAVLTLCSLCGWLLRPKRAPLKDAISSAVIGVVAVLCLLYLPNISGWVSDFFSQARQIPRYSSAAADENSQTFHEQSRVDFGIIAPLSVALVTGLLCLIPERRPGIKHLRIRGPRSGAAGDAEDPAKSGRPHSSSSGSSRRRRRRSHRT